MVSFISESEQSLNVAVIAGAIAGGFVFMLIVVVALVLVIVGLWVRFNRLSKNLKEDAIRYSIITVDYFIINVTTVVNVRHIPFAIRCVLQSLLLYNL